MYVHNWDATTPSLHDPQRCVTPTTPNKAILPLSCGSSLTTQEQQSTVTMVIPLSKPLLLLGAHPVSVAEHVNSPPLPSQRSPTILDSFKVVWPMSAASPLPPLL